MPKNAILVVVDREQLRAILDYCALMFINHPPRPDGTPYKATWIQSTCGASGRLLHYHLILKTLPGKQTEYRCNLGWELETIDRLQAFRDVLQGSARASMDRLLKALMKDE